MSWPTEYVKVTLADPNLLSDSTFSTPVRDVTASSSLVVTSLSTSSGEAPGHDTLTCNTGLSMSGVIWIGIFWSATTPKAIIKKTKAATAIGCLIASLIILSII